MRILLYDIAGEPMKIIERAGTLFLKSDLNDAWGFKILGNNDIRELGTVGDLLALDDGFLGIPFIKLEKLD